MSKRNFSVPHTHILLNESGLFFHSGPSQVCEPPSLSPVKIQREDDDLSILGYITPQSRVTSKFMIYPKQKGLRPTYRK